MTRLPGDSKRAFATLDALRGVAAIAVALRHLKGLLWGAAPFSSYLAVDFFFCLSGFVLAYAYEPRLHVGLSVRRFMRMRLVRLYPLYFAALIIGLAAVVIGTFGLPRPPNVLTFLQTALVSLAFSVCFFPTPLHIPHFQPTLFQLDPPIWSIFYELVINAAYAAAFQWLSSRVLCVIVACSAAVLCIAVVHFGSLDVGWSVANFWGGAARVAFSFPCGVLLCRLWRSGKLHYGISPWLLIAALAAMSTVHLEGGLQAIFDLSMALCGFPLLIALGANADRGLRSSELRLFTMLGIVSYALYVLHVPALELVKNLSASIHVTPSAPAGGIILLVALIAATLVLDRWYDRPLRALLAKRAGA